MKKNNLIIPLLLLVLLILPLKVRAASMLKSIEVEGIGQLNVQKNSWNVTLTTTLSYANVIVAPANDTIQLEGGGQVDIQEGANTIVIKATDGTNTEEYTLNINVVKTSGGNNSADPKNPDVDDEGTTKNPETGSFISEESLIITVAAFVITGIIIKIKKKIYKIN